MRIDLGTNIDPSWIGLIAYSSSDTGNNWNTFGANNITINSSVIQPPTGASYNPLFKENQYKIQIFDNSNGKLLIEFLLSNVSNQVGWTNNQVGLNQAVSDISSWFSVGISASVSVSYLPTPSPTSASAASCSSHRTFGLSQTPVQIKGSSGNLYGYTIINTNPYPVYVKFCDQLAASVVVGTTGVVKTIYVPAYGQIYQDPSSVQKHFGTAISVYTVRGYLDTNTTSVTTNRVIFEAQYE